MLELLINPPLVSHVLNIIYLFFILFLHVLSLSFHLNIIRLYHHSMHRDFNVFILK